MATNLVVLLIIWAKLPNLFFILLPQLLRAIVRFCGQLYVFNPPYFTGHSYTTRTMSEGEFSWKRVLYTGHNIRPRAHSFLIIKTKLYKPSSCFVYVACRLWCQMSYNTDLTQAVIKVSQQFPNAGRSFVRSFIHSFFRSFHHSHVQLCIMWA